MTWVCTDVGIVGVLESSGDTEERLLLSIFSRESCKIDSKLNCTLDAIPETEIFTSFKHVELWREVPKPCFWLKQYFWSIKNKSISLKLWDYFGQFTDSDLRGKTTLGIQSKKNRLCWHYSLCFEFLFLWSLPAKILLSLFSSSLLLNICIYIYIYI